MYIMVSLFIERISNGATLTCNQGLIVSLIHNDYIHKLAVAIPVGICIYSQPIYVKIAFQYVTMAYG